MKKLRGMKFQRINLFVFVQVVLLALTPAVFALIINSSALVVTRIALVIIWLFQIIVLYRYLGRSEKKLREAVMILGSGDDFHLIKKKELSGIQNSILIEINDAISRFRSLKLQKEADLLLFRSIIESVPIGIMVLDQEFRVSSINSYALKLFNLHELSSLDQMNSLKEGVSDWFRALPEKLSSVLELDLPSRSYKLSVTANSMRLIDREMILFTIKDIKKEVDRKELETWHNMLRVVSHEVVNSVSPITLSSGSMSRNVNTLI